MSAEDFVPEPPKPLRRPLAKPEPFPVEALGNVLGKAAQAINEKIQAPLAICGQSVLAVASLAVQAHVDVMLPIGQRKPVSNYFLSIAASGERKTASDSEAVTPVKEHEKNLWAEYDSDQVTWKNAYDAHEKQRQNILKDTKYKTSESRAAALDQIGQAPPAPLTPMLMCPEPTFEGMCRLLLSGHPSLGIFSSEGGQFIGGHSMTEENKLKTAAAISGAWDGEPIRRVLALVETLHARDINEHHLAAGIQLAQYYASEALRLFDASQIDPDLELAIRLLHHLQHSWPLDMISLPDVYQRCLNAIRDKSTASKIVGILEGHGWMVRIEGGATIDGVRRKEAWKIIKEASHETIS